MPTDRTPTAEELLSEASRIAGHGWDGCTGFSQIATLLADRCASAERSLADALAEVTAAIKLNYELRQRAEAAEAEVSRLRSAHNGEICVDTMEYSERLEGICERHEARIRELEQREAQLRELAKLGNYTGTSILEIKRLLGLDGGEK